MHTKRETDLIIGDGGSAIFWEGQVLPGDTQSSAAGVHIIQPRELERVAQWRFWEAVVGRSHVGQARTRVGPRHAFPELAFNTERNL